MSYVLIVGLARQIFFLIVYYYIRYSTHGGHNLGCIMFVSVYQLRGISESIEI